MTTPDAPMGTPSPSGGGMPKWLLIVGVILLIVIVGCCGGITSCWFLARKAVKSAPDFIRQQAKQNGVDINLPGSTGGAVQLPANFPSDIPPYAGAAIVMSASQPNDSGSVQFTTLSSAANVKTFYDQQLAKNGWTSESSQQTAGGTTEAFTKDTRTVSIQITPASPTHVMILYAKK